MSGRVHVSACYDFLVKQTRSKAGLSGLLSMATATSYHIRKTTDAHPTETVRLSWPCPTNKLVIVDCGDEMHLHHRVS